MPTPMQQNDDSTTSTQRPEEDVEMKKTTTNNEPIADANNNAPALAPIATSSSSAPEVPSKITSTNIKDVEFHHLTIQEIVQHFNLDEKNYEDGLQQNQIESQRQKFGPNTIPMPEGRSLFMIIINNFANVITVILGVVVGVSIWLQDYVEVGVVAFVIIFNGLLGTYQEYGAEKSAEALKKMTAGTAKLRRNGHVNVCDIQEVVVGDIIVLDQGASVPADIRLIDVNNLQCAEDALTGEAHPISKFSDKIDVDPNLDGKPLPVGDRKNMAYRQTTVVNGSATGIVVTVGEKTELGKITSSLAADTNTETPLQVSMRYLMYALFVVCLFVVLIVFGANRWDDSGSTIIYACAVAIAVLPEALLAVITVAMTVSMKRMAELKCIVRKLNALEVLASVTDICSDKTGTLTQNVMAVRYVQIGTEKLVKVDAAPRSSAATMNISGTEEEFVPQTELRDSRAFYSFVRACALNASCDLHKSADGTGKLEGAGNPSEVAIQAFCWQSGLHQDKFREKLDYEPRGVYPFDSKTKMMTVGYFHKPTAESKKYKSDEDRRKPDQNDSHVFVKGAPERIMEKCTMSLRHDGTVVQFTSELRKVVDFAIEELAKKGLRCIAIAERAPNTFDLENQRVQDIERSELEQDLIFLGLTGIWDPPRTSSLDACKTCQAAGIRVRMLTGDHLSTATVISSMVGIIGQDSDLEKQTINGPDFDHLAENDMLADRDLDDMPFVVGRCSPQSKVHMVKNLQAKGGVVAMTGDGFNDSPSIKDADIGMAMGSAVDATKGVAELIITDDDFSTIVKAVAEGRRIRSCISKFIIHLLSGNVAEVIALVIGLAIQINERSVFIISPVQILWLNTFTGVFPAIGLTADSPDPDLLLRAPAKGSVITKELIFDTIVYGTALGASTLGGFVTVYFGVEDGASPNAKDCNEQSRVNCEVPWRARTTAWVILYVGLLLHGYNVRHNRNSIFQMKWFDNAWLYLSLIGNIIGLMPLIYIEEVANTVFYTDPISWEWWVIIVYLFVFMFCCEMYKLLKNYFFPVVYGSVEVGPALQQESSIVLPKVDNYEVVKHMQQFVAPVDNNLTFTYRDVSQANRRNLENTYTEMARTESFQLNATQTGNHRLADDGLTPGASPAMPPSPPKNKK